MIYLYVSYVIRYKKIFEKLWKWKILVFFLADNQ